MDAGKTTLAEGLLYVGGALRRLGRVDHGDAFLDTDAVERERGITVFAKQAVLPLGDVELTLLDTPGHVDFSSEMERTLQVLDGALLVVSGTDGVQSHTRTLWRLLQRYQVPTFVFVNKMDLAGADKTRVLEELGRLDGGFVDFTAPDSERDEAAAMCSEEALEEFLETGAVSKAALARLTGERKLFPCWFGSALKLEGVEELLSGLETGLPEKEYPRDFAARVFKISRDGQGTRLTCLKVTGGALRPKEPHRGWTRGEEGWEEKVDQLRLYSGEKFRTLEEAPAGTVCAVTGLTRPGPARAWGRRRTAPGPVLEPVLSYQLILPPGHRPPHRPAQAAPAGGGGPHAAGGVERGAGRRSTCSSWGRCSWRCSAAAHPDRFGVEAISAPGAISSTGRPSPGRWRGWATSSPCATTPRSICCWSRESGAAACALGPAAPPTSWTSTGSGSSSPT